MAQVEQRLLSVVVPLYNERDLIVELVTRICRSCASLEEDFEIVAVNDGSHDETLPLLVALSDDVPELRVVDLSRNFGHMCALTAGLFSAAGDAVIVMDGDLQDVPELIPDLVAQWKDGADVVCAVRVRRAESWIKRAATSAFYWLLDRTAEYPIPRQVGTYGLMRRWVVDALNAMPERGRYFAGLRAWVGGDIRSVSYTRPDRPGGRSRVGYAGLFRLARTALISFSKKPLRIASMVSMLCAFVMFLVGVGATTVRLFTNLAVPGWATYTTLIGLMGFVQSLVLALLAEYVAVIFDEVKHRPLFLVHREFRRGHEVKGASDTR